MRKLVVIGTSKSEQTNAVCNYLAERFEVVALVCESPVPRSAFLKKRIKKLGLLVVIGQIAFQAGIAPLLQRSARGRIRDIKQHYGLNTDSPSVTVISVDSVNSSECWREIAAHSPDAVVLAGTRILNKTTIEQISSPVINIHAGITPLYRGVHGAYWALAEGRKELCGVTVHRVDAGIDTGQVLMQSRIPVTAQDNFSSYPWLQIGEGVRLLEETLRNSLRASEPLTSESSLRTHPTAFEYLANRLRGVK